MKQLRSCHVTSQKGFSLIEVVLAIGIFLVTVLALVGLLGPTLQSVDEVEKTDEISSVVNTINAFLQSSQDIAIRDSGGVVTTSEFEAVYNSITSASGNEATLFVYRYYEDPADPTDPPLIKLEVGFAVGEPVGDNAIVNEPNDNTAAFSEAAGTIYRVVLSISSVTPADHRSPIRNGDGIYTLSTSYAAYPEGFLAMEVRIFAEDPPGPNQTFATTTDLSVLVDEVPIFTYNTAIVR
jgi:type II secretory pathway pseudopilin PulG